MSREVLNLKQAAELVHLEMNELRHFAQRGEIEATERGGDWYFELRALNEWAQRNLLSETPRDLRRQHQAMIDEERRENKSGWGVADLFKAEAISLSIAAKAKAGILRDMTDLAEKSGHLYDPEALFRELEEREAVASTAIGEEVALLHPRFHDPFLFEESFIAYGRSERPIFFGAPDGEGTRHFFLICTTDHEKHLHILAKLAVLAHGTNLVERLDAADSPEAVLAAVAACEADFRR